MHTRMGIEERLDALGFVRREVIDNHMDLTPARLGRDQLGQEVDERGTGMPRHGLADDLAGAGVERGIQREGAMPVVLEAVTFGTAGRERQDRVQAVQRLDRRLFIRGKHDRVLGRIQVESNHVGGLLLELRIIRQHVSLQPMGLIARATPDASDQHVTNPQHLPQLTGRPVGAAIRWFLPRLRQHARLECRRPHRRRLSTVFGAQSGQPLGFKSLFPPADVIGITAHGRRDRGEGVAVGEHQDHLGTSRILRADLAAPNPAFQLGAFIGRQCQRHMAQQYTTSNSVVTVH
jgi:hypothetical protein